VEILIIHPGGLGDIILSLPAVVSLRDRFPSARIAVAGNIDHLVPVMSGYAETALPISALPLHYLFTAGAVPESAVKFWRTFDLIVSWTGGGDPEFSKKFKEIHPNVCVASWRPAAGDLRHVSQLFVDSLGFVGNRQAGAAPPPILLNSELLAAGRDWLAARGWNDRDTLIVLHPGAGSKIKRWPVSRFTEFARRVLLEDRRRLLIVEGSAERGLAGQIARALPADRAAVFDSMSLNLLAAVVAHGNLFVGNDSGVAHLAAALNVRCIVLFGPTAPQHWAPLGKNVTVLRNARGCEACTSAGNHHTCLENITVEEVIRNSEL
jgi:hypothetical protein